jgi:hypothetical protein
MEYGTTAHNRTVYASPPVVGSGYGFVGSLRYAPFPRKTSATFCLSLFFALQSPYSDGQNVVNSRNVMLIFRKK